MITGYLASDNYIYMGAMLLKAAFSSPIVPHAAVKKPKVEQFTADLVIVRHGESMHHPTVIAFSRVQSPNYEVYFTEWI